jgi:hypothetical protein
MPNSTPSRVLRAALFTLVPAAYLSIGLWRPGYYYNHQGREGISYVCDVLIAAVFLVSFLSWRRYRLVAVFGFLACFLWLMTVLLPVE